ncbi:MAG: GntR family transcriptional regulator / MocR family aminotransferase [Solirubrobacteraceae bacterium]|nr:GntR family transcriptional regulator / MocR family aminotransferase [Solirubrobacteraceae bacterium]
MELDRASEMPLHVQIERSLRGRIRSGRLAANAPLPSTRGMASTLGVSRGVITEAYGQLAAEGYLTTRQGAPVRVAPTVRGVERPAAGSLLAHYPYNFHPGLPDLAGFPREAWLRSLRASLRSSPLDGLGYGDPRGAPPLREALAEHLNRVRGCDADPEHMIVCAGFMQGFSLLCRALRGRGVEQIALEEPGWHVHRLIVEQSGLEVVPISVDEHGIVVDELAATDVATVLVTPANQFPTGAVMTPERRAALVDWAGEEKLIVEDDYDSEYRYDRVAVGALQGLAPERIAHIGSTSKRLAPGLRLGWMLLPSWLTWELTASKTIEDGGSEIVGQLALRDFIVQGELDRHVRRMRLSYRARREALLAALARWLPQSSVESRGAAGLFALVGLPAGADEAALVRAAAARGVGVEALSLHRYAAGGEPALLLGYGSLPEPAIERGIRLLADAAAEVGV